MKKINDIKHGDRVLNLLSKPCLFSEIVNKSFLDTHVVQRVLAALQKSAYIVKDERGLWVAKSKEHSVISETNSH